MSYRLRTAIAMCVASLVCLAAGRAHAGLIAADAVFAHDFENISGNNVTALFGPDAVKTSNLSASTTDPIDPFSQQQIEAAAIAERWTMAPGPNGMVLVSGAE